MDFIKNQILISEKNHNFFEEKKKRKIEKSEQHTAFGQWRVERERRTNVI